LRALRKRKPQETQALALASSQSWLPLLRPSIPIIGWCLRLLREIFTHFHAIAFEWKPGFILPSVNCVTDCRRRISIRCCAAHCLRRIDQDVKIAFIESDSDRINRQTARDKLVPSLSLFVVTVAHQHSTQRAPASLKRQQQITLISVS